MTPFREIDSHLKQDGKKITTKLNHIFLPNVMPLHKKFPKVSCTSSLHFPLTLCVRLRTRYIMAVVSSCLYIVITDKLYLQIASYSHKNNPKHGKT